MTLVTKVPTGIPGANYQLITTNNDCLPVILEEEGGGPAGPLSPVHNQSVVQGGPTAPAGPENGAYSGDNAWQFVTPAVAAAPDGTVFVFSPGNYAGEPAIAYVEKNLSFSGQTSYPLDTVIPELTPSSLGSAIELHLQNVTGLVNADFTLVGALRLRAENSDVGVAGFPDNVEVTLVNCFVNQSILAASIIIRNCTFGASALLAGSVSIDAQSWETAVQTVGPAIFPASTTILGTLTGQASVSAFAVPDDGAPYTVITLDHPGTPVAGFTSIMQAALVITPDSALETPEGTVTLTDPDAGALTLAWGPIPLGDSVYVPFSLFGSGSGNWLVAVTVLAASGDVTVDATLLLVKS